MGVDHSVLSILCYHCSIHSPLVLFLHSVDYEGQAADLTQPQSMQCQGENNVDSHIYNMSHPMLFFEPLAIPTDRHREKLLLQDHVSLSRSPAPGWGLMWPAGLDGGAQQCHHVCHTGSVHLTRPWDDPWNAGWRGHVNIRHWTKQLDTQWGRNASVSGWFATVVQRFHSKGEGQAKGEGRREAD